MPSRPSIFRSWIDLPPAARGCTVALGNFDGVHQGHAHVVRHAQASQPGAPLAVLTFEPHPREIFHPDAPPFRLTMPPERLRALRALGVEVIFEIPFTPEFRAMTALDFVHQVLHQGLGACHLTCGPDFAFGHRRAGNATFLAEQAHLLGMGITVVAPLCDAQGQISSSRVRDHLRNGQPEAAHALLGRSWSIQGQVAHGDQRGRTIGFPTANIGLGRHLEPARGVYAITAQLADGQVIKGVANIGTRPTVNGQKSRVEAHLFDWSGDLYGQDVSVALHHFLRPERRFADLAELTTQIATDAAQARSLLHQHA